MTVVVELTLIPSGVGTSVSKYIAESLKILKKENIEYIVTPMATVFEVNDASKAYELILKMQKRIFELGVPRLLTIVKMDERRDKEDWGMHYKVKSVTEKIDD